MGEFVGISTTDLLDLWGDRCVLYGEAKLFLACSSFSLIPVYGLYFPFNIKKLLAQKWKGKEQRMVAN